MHPHARKLTVVPTAPAQDEEPLDFDGLFRRYANYVGRIGLSILGREHEVDDLVQDVFLLAHTHLAELKSAAAVKGWLAKIAVRRAGRLVQKRRRVQIVDLDAHSADLQARGTTPEQRAMFASLYRELDGMPVEVRIAWTLRHVHGEKLDEVARLCECSLATAKRRIATAHRDLEEALGDR